jgi:ADP-ribose pyrophosphatase YjhB (NUDIX family)
MKPKVSKDIVVAALITDAHNNILIVKPAHKDGWILPGGYVETSESPRQACQREIAMELGITMEQPERLLTVDYRGHSGEYVMFIFDGGVFTDQHISQITLPPTLVAYKFVSQEEALNLLRPNSARRLPLALNARSHESITYLEH